MKKALLIGVVGLVLSSGPCLAQMGQGMMTDSAGEDAAQSEQYSSPCGMGYGMGSGMMGGYGMGSGMMGGYGMGSGMMGGYGMGSGMMSGYGMGPGMMRGYYGRRSGRGSGVWKADPEKYNKFMDETLPLRKKIHEKQFDYFEAARNPETSHDALMKMEKELFDLRQQMQKKGWETFHQ